MSELLIGRWLVTYYKTGQCMKFRNFIKNFWKRCLYHYRPTHFSKGTNVLRVKPWLSLGYGRRLWLQRKKSKINNEKGAQRKPAHSSLSLHSSTTFPVASHEVFTVSPIIANYLSCFLVLSKSTWFFSSTHSHVQQRIRWYHAYTHHSSQPYYML